jgi:pimeloyl-ACP methyl ester carboxylesterase
MQKSAARFCALSLLCAASAASACVESGEAVCASAACGAKFKINTTSNIQIYRSYSLTKTHCAVTRAIVVLHGRGGTGADIFSTLTSAAQLAGKTASTLIVAPFFPDTRDGTQALLASDLAWRRDSGSQATYDAAMGGISVAPTQVSAFKVVDDLVANIANSGRFPNLASITVAGHSGGGQFAQRYAAGGNRVSVPAAIRLHYVVANPSSYLYLDPKRPASGSMITFTIPSSTLCRWYNVYGYGLDDLVKNTYMNTLTPAQIVSRYTPRKVTYLLGALDTGTSNLDTSCYASAQGYNRYTRGTAYSNYLKKYFPSATNHVRVVVPNVGHTASGMFRSTQGLGVLFGN